MSTEAERPADCRCGRAKADQENDHLCHGQGYTCPRVGKVKFYVPGPYSLSGQTLKASALKTWACGPCWQTWNVRQLAAGRATWYAGRAPRDRDLPQETGRSGA